MGKSDNIINFEEALKTKENKEKFEAALKKIAEEKTAKNDGEALQKAAKELGFDLSLEELEHSLAEKQEMPDEELDKVAGGSCGISYGCAIAWKHDSKQDKSQDCFYDYNCVLVLKAQGECKNQNYTIG